MVAVGPMEILVTWLTFFPALWGIPVGMPPAPPDPLMAQVAPERVLFYTAWSGAAVPDGDSTNHVEQLLAEPDLQRVLTAIDRQISQSVARMAGPQRDQVQGVAAELMPRLLTLLLSQPGAVFVSDIRAGEAGPEIEGAMLLRLGDHEREVTGLVERLPLEGTRHIQLDGVSFRTFEMEGEVRRVSWGIWRNCLVIGVGEDEVARLIARADQEPPAWWGMTKERLDLPRISSLSYLNLERLWEMSGEFGGPELPATLAALGLDSATSVMSVCGLDETDFVARSLIRVEGPAEGLLKLLDAEPLDVDQLRSIPRNAHAATTIRLSPSLLWDTLLERLGRVSLDAATGLRDGLRELETALRVDIHDDLLPSLGDTWSLYAAPSNGGLLTGWTLTLSVDKPERVQRIHDQLLGLLRANLGPMEGEVKLVRTAEGEVQFMDLGRGGWIPFSPAWSLTEKEFIFALFPQAVIGHLENKSREEPLTAHPAWQRIWRESERGPLAASFVDLRPVLELVYPIVQFGAQAAFGEARRQGFDLDMSLVPSAGVFTRRAGPAVAAAFRTEDGLEFSRRQPLPGGSLEGTLPITMAMMLPAIQASRSAARRTQGANNLRQIGLAMHNFEATFNSLPAAYSIDDEGEPLLSWRVHLLPFLQEAALYDEFKLDEPWDSEHNRKLIERMPPVFAAVGSELEEGKTNYVAVRGDRAIFAVPNADQAGRTTPAGIGFRHILDGTSNTIAVVEASDERGVIWTKPDDLPYDERDPMAGLVGLYPEGFQALFTDGSVRFIPAHLAAEILNALFTRDGGEVVPNF